MVMQWVQFGGFLNGTYRFVSDVFHPAVKDGSFVKHSCDISWMVEIEVGHGRFVNADLLVEKIEPWYFAQSLEKSLK